MKLTAADLYVIHDIIYHSLITVNYGGKFPDDVRARTMNKIMDILAYADMEVTYVTAEEPEVKND
jgi:hypothetical protein